MGVFANVEPLKRSADFRRYFAGNIVSLAGSMLTSVALRYQTYALTKSTVMVGTLAIVQLVPLLIATIGFGQLADAFDKRKILLTTQVVFGVTSALLAVNARRTAPSLAVLFVLAALQSLTLGIDWPTRSSLTPRLVGQSLITPAVALNMAAFNIVAVAGPILGGQVVKSSIWLAYALDSASYVWLFTALLTIKPQPASATLKVGFGAIADGLRYVRSNRLLQSTFVADLGAMIFGVPDALFPAMAIEVFKGDAGTFGLLQAAPGVGALLATGLSGWTSKVRRAGWAIIWCIVLWGAAIVAFGLTRSLPLALMMLAIAGGADAVSAIFRSSLVAVTTPDEYRGRLSAIFVAVVRGGPRVGEFESGIASRLGGLQFAAWTGGLGVLGAIAMTAWAYPELRNYRLDPEPVTTGAGATSG